MSVRTLLAHLVMRRLVSSQQYNTLGQVLHQSAAYLLSGAAGSGYAPPVWSTVAAYHRPSYDASGALTLDETLAQSSVLWSTSTLYDGWQQQGRMTQLVNEAGANDLTRQWVYDPATLRLSTIRAGTARPIREPAVPELYLRRRRQCHKRDRCHERRAGAKLWLRLARPADFGRNQRRGRRAATTSSRLAAIGAARRSVR